MGRLGDALKAASAGDRLLRRNPILYPRALRLFDRLEAASLDERRHFTERRLQTVLAAAARTPYGRRIGAGTDLAGWPLLEKATLRDEPAAFAGRGSRFAAHASTSGTTGTPLKLLRSATSVAVEQAAIDRLARAKGLELASARVAVLRGDDVGRPGSDARFWRDAGGGRRRIFSSNNLSGETLEAYVAAIEDFAPTCLQAYPTVLESLCSLLERAGRRLDIRLTLTSSEVLSNPARRLAENVLGTQIVDYYGQAERVNLAYSFTEDAYVFLPGYGATELVPAGTNDDGDLFEIVGTCLWNLAMPLVRYRTGDLVRLPKAMPSEELDAICYGLRPVPGILGRDNDYLVAPSGAKLVGIDHIPRDVENVLRLQIVQERRELVRILVLPAPTFRDDDRAQIAVNVERKLPADMRYSIEVVESLERMPQLKTPLVVRRDGVDRATH